MNIPITTVGSQVYVQFPSVESTSFANISPTTQDDVHICGACKQNFSDINLFVEHKRTGCVRNNLKATATTSAILGQPTLGYISTTTGNEDLASPLGPPIFRVIVDGSNLSVQPGSGTSKQAVSARENGDPSILRPRLLRIQNDQQMATVQQQNIATTSAGMQTIVMQQPPKREFEIDEEAVASILANQLANEDVSTHPNLSPSRSGPILVLGNMDNDMILPDSREHLDLDPIGLPSEEAVALELPSDKPSCPVKVNVNSEMNEQINRTASSSARKTLSREVKDDLWAQTTEKSAVEVQEQQNLQPVATSSTAEMSTPTLTLSTTSKSRGKKRHDCTFVGCSFSSCYPKDLVRHTRRHTGERPFQCDTCQRTFSRGDKLQMHLRIHSGIKPHRCDQCDYATIDSGSLRKHMRIHNDERPYKCQICPYRSRDSSQLTVHLRTHTGDNPFVCPYDSCTSAFKTSSDLKRHSRMHTGEKPFACEFCDYKCAIKSNLRVHLRLNHTEVKPVPCSTCSHISTSKRAAKEHEIIHADEVLKCGVCLYTSISTSSMKSHMRTHSQDKPFSCKHCSYACRVQGNLKSHVKKKHPDVRVMKKGKNNVKDTTQGKGGSNPRVPPKPQAHSKPYCYKSYRCTYCDAAFVREDSWRSHMRQHQAQESSLPIAVAVLPVPCENKIDHKNPPTADTCEQPRNVTVLESDNMQPPTELLEQDSFMISLDTQNQGKESTKFDKQLQKPKDTLEQNESSNKNKGKDNVDKVGQIMQSNEPDASQPLLLYVQSPQVNENMDDSLRNAEILASLNQGAPILVAGRCGQYIIPTDQNIVEQLAASLQPGTTYQYVLSSPLEGVVGNDGAFIHATSGNDTELSSHVDTAIHIPPLISLHMEKQSMVEDKN